MLNEHKVLALIAHDGKKADMVAFATFNRDTLAEYQTPAPVAAVVQQLVSALMAAGQGDADYSALATVLFDLAGLDR